jgi:hypothetical protein
VATIQLFATTTDLTAWPGFANPASIDLDALVRAASLIVGQATVSAVYDVDDDGVATGTDEIDALRDATCAQAAALAANSVNPTAGVAGASGAVQASSIGSASVQYAVAADAGAQRQALLTQLTGEAAMILRGAGLTGGQPYLSWG